MKVTLLRLLRWTDGLIFHRYNSALISRSAVDADSCASPRNYASQMGATGLDLFATHYLRAEGRKSGARIERGSRSNVPLIGSSCANARQIENIQA